MGFSAPIIMPEKIILPEWIDSNGHMNVAYYLMAFDESLDIFFEDEDMKMGESYLREEKASSFTLECHIHYLRELREGDPFQISLQLLDKDAKRIHAFMRMHHAREGYLAATCEQMLIHVDMVTRRASPFPKRIVQALDKMMEAHRRLPKAEGAGRTIGIAQKK